MSFVCTANFLSFVWPIDTSRAGVNAVVLWISWTTLPHHLFSQQRMDACVVVLV